MNWPAEVKPQHEHEHPLRLERIVLKQKGRGGGESIKSATVQSTKISFSVNKASIKITPNVVKLLLDTFGNAECPKINLCAKVC